MKTLQLTNLTNRFNKKARYKLGNWCVNYKNYNDKKIKIIDYHWNDRKKLFKDYFYLKKLKKKILVLLKNKLNKFYNENNDLRYWQIILDPHLSYIISTFFDRWEVINSLKGNYSYINYNFQNKDLFFQDTEDFIREIISNDYINQYIFQEIIKFKFKKKLIINENIKINKIYKKKNKFLHQVDKTKKIKNLLSKKNKILFFDTYFNSKSFYLLNLKLNQFPLNLKVDDIFHNKVSNKKINVNLRENILKKFNAKSRFEKFIKKNLGKFLLRDAIEDYSHNLKYVNEIKLRPSIIISSGMHNYSTIFKHWIACRIQKKTKFFIAEHGGSLAEPSHFYDLEEEISDKMLTWHRPFIKKQFQLPAQKFINSKKINYKNNQKCLLISNRVTRYSFRAEFYPLTGNNFKLIDFNKKFFQSIPLKIRKETLIKLHPNDDDSFWQNKKIYECFVKKNNIISDKSILPYFRQSKIVICLYPETTFAESIIYNVPTILIYQKSMYETHKKLTKLIELMKNKKIIFDNIDSAIDHLKDIWDDPAKWWEKKDLQITLNHFKKDILGLNDKGKNIDLWRNFLSGKL